MIRTAILCTLIFASLVCAHTLHLAEINTNPPFSVDGNNVQVYANGSSFSIKCDQ